MERYRPEFGYKYPDRTDQHMIDVPHQVDTHFDENFNYYDKSKTYKFKRFWLNVLLHTIVFPINVIRHGLKIYGRKEFKKHWNEYKNGAITICNHVIWWDYICVMQTIRPHLEYMMAWPVNFEGPNRKLIRLVGGVPIPTTLRALAKWNGAMNDILQDGNLLHVYPEGSMWFYYYKLRPFKKGAFTYAVKNNKPIIPMAISYRKPKGLERLFHKKDAALINMHIGEPIYPNMELPKEECVMDLLTRSHIKVQELMGITKDDPDYNPHHCFEVKE